MAGKTNAQIQQDFARMPTLQQFGTAAADLGRIAASGLSGTLANNLVGGDEAVREARVRAGLVGDVANVGSMVVGAKGLGTVVKGLGAAARTVPAAAQVARSGAPLAAAKLVMGRAPAALVPAATAKITKAGAAKAAGVLGLLGLSAAGRQDDTVAPAPATPAQAVKSAMDQGRKSKMRELTPQERTLAALDSVLREGFTMRDLSTVAGALPGVVGAASKASQKDMIYGKASSTTDELYKANLAAAAQLTDQAARDKAIQDATENYRRNLLETLGVDPSKQALAEILAQQNGE